MSSAQLSQSITTPKKQLVPVNDVYYMYIKYSTPGKRQIECDGTVLTNDKYQQIQIQYDNGKATFFLSDSEADLANSTPKFELAASKVAIKDLEQGVTKKIAWAVKGTPPDWKKIYEGADNNDIIIIYKAGELSVDGNGVLLIYKKLEGGKELILKNPPTGNGELNGQGYNIDQRNDGVRYNLNGDFAPAVDFGGYFKPKNVGNVDDEVSFKFFGGTHNKDNPKFARCYDIGIHFHEDTVRLRTEHEHNANGGGPYVTMEESKNINIGSISDRWVGYRVIAIHEGQGDARKTRIITLIDNDGIKDDGKPANNWKKVADWTDEGDKYFNLTQGEYPNPLQHGPPYGKYPYNDGSPQQTIRIDSVKRQDGDIEDQCLWCREIDPSQPLSDIIT